MSDVLDKLRSRYKGASFVSLLSNVEVPWNPLSIGDYIRHSSNRIDPEEVIENQIFQSCVTDPYLRRQMLELDAGTVSTTVHGILEASFPRTIDEFNAGVHYYRMGIRELAWEDIVLWILTAFPAYTPEDVYAMDLDTFLHRVALAEAKLMRAGILQGPLLIEKQTDEPSKAKKKAPPPEDLKKIYEEAHGIHDQPKVKKPVQTSAGTVMPPDLPPDDAPPVVITAAEEERHSKSVAHGQEEMLKETLPFYQEYIEKMKHGKLTPEDIKTPEQRVEDAKERMEQNQEEWAQQLAEYRKGMAQRSSEIQKKFEKGLSRRQRTRLRK